MGLCINKYNEKKYSKQEKQSFDDNIEWSFSLRIFSINVTIEIEGRERMWTWKYSFKKAVEWGMLSSEQ